MRRCFWGGHEDATDRREAAERRELTAAVGECNGAITIRDIDGDWWCLKHAVHYVDTAKSVTTIFREVQNPPGELTAALAAQALRRHTVQH